jgi:pSer/pThr/pTyr-binding forkhead associated (FHA) protein
MQIGLLKSINPSTFKDLILTPNEIIFGRSPKSTVILEDIRCSGFHCSLTPIQSSSWEFLIKDQSSNGTYLNGQLVI